MDPESREAADAAEVERLYEYGEQLSEAKDKSQHASAYKGLIMAVKGESMKAKQLAAQLIPRYFKFFPGLVSESTNAMFDLVEEFQPVGTRVHAIRGLPLLCKDNPDYVSKIVDVLGQLLTSEENVERDAVQKSLMSLLRQDVKASLSTLFKHVDSGMESIREKVISYLRDKVFPLKAELLQPQAEMERYVTNLVKSLKDVTGAEFKSFIDFLKGFSIFGEGARPEHVQELVEIIEGQADLDAVFNVSDGDHIDRLIACMFMALPFFMRGASSSKFLNYFNKYIIPVFDKFPEERKLDLLKNFAGISPYATAQDSRQLLPSVVQLLRKYLPRRRTEETNFNYVECLLFAFHRLAYKTPNSTNSLCGYHILTGQPSDRLGEDFSESYKDFTERLSSTEEIVRAAMNKLTQGMAEYNKQMSAAKTESDKASIKEEQQKTTTSLRMCNNILAMTQPLHSKSPTFMGESKIRLSWMEPLKPSNAAAAGGKRMNGSTARGGLPAKRGRGNSGVQNQLVNRAFEGLSRGGRGRGWGNRGRGRGYH